MPFAVEKRLLVPGAKWERQCWPFRTRAEAEQYRLEWQRKYRGYDSRVVRIPAERMPLQDLL